MKVGKLVVTEGELGFEDHSCVISQVDDSIPLNLIANYQNPCIVEAIQYFHSIFQISCRFFSSITSTIQPKITIELRQLGWKSL